MSTTTDSSVKPTLIVGADSRFATTFLSTKYRDKAVAGEALMDKTTGELYIKRVSDGKIVSFYQNKKMIDDLAFELRMLLLNNPTFVYPSENETTFYISTNYDLISINNESLFNLTTDDIVIPGAPDDVNKLTFNLSGKSNGFFCRSCTRDIDKPFIEYLTMQYNNIIKNYTGDNEDYLVEYEKFDTIDKWENSNAVLTYDITINKDGVEHTYTNLVDYIRMNDNVAVFIPDIVYSEVDSFDSATITIKNISFDKIHFMFNHMEDFDVSLTDAFNKLMANDGRVEIGEFHISHFVNDVSDINVLGNETIISLMTSKHINEYMAKMMRMFGSSVEISDTQPNFKCLWFKPTIE
jgi:hypothetical protein